jgi:hypothetical protein
MKKTRITAAVVLVIVLIALLLARCSSSSSPSDTQSVSPIVEPTEELALLGVQCETPGEVVEKSGATFVCTPTKKVAESTAVYYGVAAPADDECDEPGATRSIDGVFSVCSNDKEPKKRKWLITVPMPVAVTAFIDEGASTEPAALEAVGVPIPEAIATLPGMQEFAVATPSTAPATTLAPTSTSAVETTDTPTTLGDTTLPDSMTTEAAPTTTAATSATTEAAPTTTTETPATTTTTTTTTAPKAPVASCAQGGPCKDGDIGPAGGLILLANFMLNEPPTLIEVAPTTWFGTAAKAKVYVDKLTYGGFDDWVVPNRSQLLTMRRERARFACAAGTRCTNGFNASTYWAATAGEPTDTVSFAGTGDPQPAGVGTGHFVRPVRVIGTPGEGGFVLPPLEEA